VKWALPVVVVDIAKGFVPVYFFGELAGVGASWTLAYGGAAIGGHMFSLWVGFKGGKGMATSAGVFLALAPWAVLGGFLVWLGVTLPTGYVSLGSIGAAFALPFLIAFTPHRGGGALVWFAAGLAAFVIWKHRSNIRRLMRGEENRFRSREGDASGGTTTSDDGPGLDAPTG
jgi:glycerol-3-phosphate acyltransferase PlsY